MRLADYRLWAAWYEMQIVGCGCWVRFCITLGASYDTLQSISHVFLEASLGYMAVTA